MPQINGTIPSAQHRRKINGLSLVPPRQKFAPQPIDHHAHQVQAPSPGFLEICWPAVFGLILAVIAPGILNKVWDDWGEVGERLIFPFVLLAGRPEFGFGAELTRNLPVLVLYLTFPFFGFYATWKLRRRVRMTATLAQIVFVNLITAFVLWLLSRPGASHGM